MSRAFVRESDVPQLPELPPQASPLPPGARNYLTLAGAERLRRELSELLDVRRPPLASASGDDLDAKRELQTIDRRVRYLQESLRTAEVVTPDRTQPDVVRFGAFVTVREANRTDATYHIVGVDETEGDPDAISWVSPLARALLNARVGEHVTFRAPRGERRYEIKAVRYDENQR